jgi:predicted secreted protein
MSISGALALYFIVWWLTLFAILPLGIRSQHENGEVTDGTEPGAPMLPRMGRKVVLTTLVAIPVFALAWVFIVYVEY